MIEVGYIRCLTINLTAHNWQKWKRVFLTCPCHKIYRGEAVGLKKVANILEELRFMWICGIWGNFVKIWYFVNNCLIEARIWSLLHMCDTYNCDYLKHSTFRFKLIDFQLNTDFPSQVCFLTVKSCSVTQRSVSQENAYKKSWNPSPFLHKTVGSNNSFTLIENNFRFLR